jgi:hypothetical protein
MSHVRKLYKPRKSARLNKLTVNNQKQIPINNTLNDEKTTTYISSQCKNCGEENQDTALYSDRSFNDELINNEKSTETHYESEYDSNESDDDGSKENEDNITVIDKNLFSNNHFKSDHITESVIIKNNNIRNDQLNVEGSNKCRKYCTLTRDEVNQLTTYTRKSFCRRCKFVSSGILNSHKPIFFRQILLHDVKLQNEKTFHIFQCVKDTLSSRRGYSTTQICHKLRGT